MLPRAPSALRSRALFFLKYRVVRLSISISTSCPKLTEYRKHRTLMCRRCCTYCRWHIASTTREAGWMHTVRSSFDPFYHCFWVMACPTQPHLHHPTPFISTTTVICQHMFILPSISSWYMTAHTSSHSIYLSSSIGAMRHSASFRM